MQSILFATNNSNKVAEINSIVPAGISVESLASAGINIDIPEPHDSLAANAREKSMTIFTLTGRDCFSEDTGLEVDALNGLPGVKSARYAGEHANAADNIKKLMQAMQGITNRKARFRTVISLVMAGQEHQFEGTCEGTIAALQSGNKGFGYDPVFIPDGSGKCFADMELAEKNQFSHRKKAVAKLIQFLQTHYGQD